VPLRDHPKSVLFRDKIGQHLAAWKGLPDGETGQLGFQSDASSHCLSWSLSTLRRDLIHTIADRYTLLDLPKGYSLFYHHKLQKDGSDRTDVYMYVSIITNWLVASLSGKDCPT
jgi:hypothetical protein